MVSSKVIVYTLINKFYITFPTSFKKNKDTWTVTDDRSIPLVLVRRYSKPGSDHMV